MKVDKVTKTLEALTARVTVQAQAPSTINEVVDTDNKEEQGLTEATRVIDKVSITGKIRRTRTNRHKIHGFNFDI